MVPFPFLLAPLISVVTTGIAAVTALGTTGMVVGGIALAGAVLVVLVCITVEEIRNRARQRAAELNRRLIKAKVLKCVEEGNYNQVHVGLYDSSNVLRDEMVLGGRRVRGQGHSPGLLIGRLPVFTARGLVPVTRPPGRTTRPCRDAAPRHGRFPGTGAFQL